MTDLPPRVSEIAPDVYDITWQAKDEGPELMQGNRWRSFLFDSEDSVPTLVDTSKRERVDVLIDSIEAIGVEPERLLITHRHSDHVGGIDAVVERFGVETWVPEKDNPYELDRVTVETPPNHVYTDGEEIGRFTAVTVPGHTPGSSVFVDEDAGIAVMGDVVSGADRRGLPSGYLIHPPQSTHVLQPPEAVVDAEENLAKLLDYDFEVALVFHGSSVREGASEKLRRYVDYEPNYVADAESIHRPSREGSDLTFYTE